MNDSEIPRQRRIVYGGLLAALLVGITIFLLVFLIKHENVFESMVVGAFAGGLVLFSMWLVFVLARTFARLLVALVWLCATSLLVIWGREAEPEAGLFLFMSLLAGVAAGLLCLSLLPYTGWLGMKKEILKQTINVRPSPPPFPDTHSEASADVPESSNETSETAPAAAPGAAQD